MRFAALLAFLYVFSAPSRSLAQTPGEAAAVAALDYVEKHEGEIGEVAREATKAQVKKNWPVLLPVNATFEQAVVPEITSSAQAATAERQREATVVTQMQDMIVKAKAAAMPIVAKTAEEWARSQALREVYTVEEPELDRVVSEGQRAEDNRQNATVTVEVAAAIAVKMVQLAREAQEVAKHLRGVHADGRASTVKEQNDFAEAQAEQSMRLSKLAQKVLQEANATASEALVKAEEAESKAQKALETARSNTLRIQSLKLRAQHTFQQAAGAALVQRKPRMAR